jgi:hypothetical protein
MHGQSLRAHGHHPLASLVTEPEVAEYLQVMPNHTEFVARDCAASR